MYGGSLTVECQANQLGDGGSNPTPPFHVSRIANSEANKLLANHYLGKAPALIVSYSDGHGAVCAFSKPRGRLTEKAFGLTLFELVRLYAPPNWNGRLSKFVSCCLALVYKEFLDIDGIISLADAYAGHIGTIYQATNFWYIGQVTKDGHPLIFIDGKLTHPKTLYSRHGSQGIPFLKSIYGNRLITQPKPTKYRYFRPMSSRGFSVMWDLKQSYPKKGKE